MPASGHTGAGIYLTLDARLAKATGKRYLVVLEVLPHDD